MQNFKKSKTTDFFPLLGNFWSDISEDEKEIIRTYWNSISKQTGKLYKGLYSSFLSKGIEYSPAYFENTDEYLTIVFSGVNKNVWERNGSYRYNLDDVVSIPKLIHRINDPAFPNLSDLTYLNGVHYSITEGRYIEFNSGLLTRQDLIYSGTSTYQSTLYAPSIIKLNPVIYGLFGDSVKFDKDYFYDRNYVPNFISSGLSEKSYSEYEIPEDALVCHFSTDYGITAIGDNYNWQPRVASGNLTAASVSGLAPTYTTDENGNAIFRFDENNVEFLEFNNTFVLDYYTVIAIAKSTSQRPYIVGGDGASHLPFAGSNSSYSFGFNYNLSAGQISDTIDPNSVSSDVFVSVATRFNDGVVGHSAYLDGVDVTDTMWPTRTGTPAWRYIGRREYPTAIQKQFGGDLYEVIIYNRVLSANEIKSIEKYASMKYNISLGYSFYDLSIKAICEHYKNLVEALCYVTSKNPTVSNIKLGYQLARGAPFAYESGTATVTANEVTVGDYSYLIPSGLPLNVVDSQEVSKFDILTSGVYLWDIINNSGLIRATYSGISDFYNKYMIEDNLSGLNYSSKFLNNYLDVINPDGLQYRIV